MYTPKHFALHEVDDWQKIEKLIRENSFATVLSFPEGERPFINHLPIIFDSGVSGGRTLIGHMAKRNPQWTHFQKNPNCTLIFHGPHTYITPLWYKSGKDVPTWNYAVVHLHGKIQLLESFEDQIQVLKKTTVAFEGSGPEAWRFGLPEDLHNASTLTAAIISFKFTVENVEAKFKLSQNRKDVDRNGVLEGLKTRTDDMSCAVRDLMLDEEKNRTQKG